MTIREMTAYQVVCDGCGRTADDLGAEYSSWEPISCFKYEELRANPAMRVHSACTNYVGGEVLDPWLPPHSYISHHDPAAGDHEQLRSWLDAAGCRHEHLREITSEAPTRDEQEGD